MAKKPISKVELAKLIRHRMDEYPECPPGISVEIRKVKTSKGPGWSAVTNPTDSISHVKCARIVGALTLELRQNFELSDD
ncbi:hypothetical protein AB8A28_19765 [Tardiphaga sp. 71_E8_N1_1]|uniref:hypothetical protein n=1 Tax=Tardiphaga sp. 71_E8_N1_1 TaxID=3240784 RepID=UPI003F895B01